MPTSGTVPFVSSNGLRLPFDEQHVAPMRDSTTLRADGSALAERYRTDGYVKVGRVLDPSRLRALRKAYFATFDPSYLAAGSDPADGRFSGRRPEGMAAHGTAGHPAHAFVRGRAFLDLCAEPALAELACTVLGSPASQLPRRILRHFDRSRPVASRAHTDFSYLDGGSDRLVTAWLPIGDCPLETGGLVYLEGSHDLPRDVLEGLRARIDRSDRRPLSHDLAWVSEQLGRRWLWSEHRAGDVVLHSPHIVHASLDVRSDTMRLSADLRWLADGAARDERWAEAWAGDDGK